MHEWIEKFKNGQTTFEHNKRAVLHPLLATIYYAFNEFQPIKNESLFVVFLPFKLNAEKPCSLNDSTKETNSSLHIGMYYIDNLTMHTLLQHYILIILICLFDKLSN